MDERHRRKVSKRRRREAMLMVHPGIFLKIKPISCILMNFKLMNMGLNLHMQNKKSS